MIKTDKNKLYYIVRKGTNSRAEESKHRALIVGEDALIKEVKLCQGRRYVGSEYVAMTIADYEEKFSETVKDDEEAKEENQR